MPFNHLILCPPLLLLPTTLPSIRVFSNESALRIRRPKYWSFSFCISSSNEYSELISFRMDWLDLLAVQGTCKSLLQHHSSKASILWHSVFFIVQLSHPYMTAGKTLSLTRVIFVGKVLSLLFNILSRLVIAFLPGSKQVFFCKQLVWVIWVRINMYKLVTESLIRIITVKLGYFTGGPFFFLLKVASRSTHHLLRVKLYPWRNGVTSYLHFLCQGDPLWGGERSQTVTQLLS